MRRPSVNQTPGVLCGQRAASRIGPTTCVSQQGFQELSPCAPRDHSDVGQEGYAMSSEWLRAVPGRSLLPPMVTCHVTRSISQLS